MEAFRQLETQAIRDKQLHASFNDKVIFKHVSKRKQVDLHVVNLIDVDSDTNEDDDSTDTKTRTFRQQLGPNITAAETAAIMQEAVTLSGSNNSPPVPGPLQPPHDPAISSLGPVFVTTKDHLGSIPDPQQSPHQPLIKPPDTQQQPTATNQHQQQVPPHQQPTPGYPGYPPQPGAL